jgi:hypothetical protein
MNLTMLQFVAFCFVLGWVGGQVVQGDYYTCLGLALFVTFIGGYSNNAHKVLWKQTVLAFKRKS